MQEKKGSISTFANDLTITNTHRYYAHEVEIPRHGWVTVKTNLSEEDLERLFPSHRARRNYLRMLARMSPVRPQKEVEE